MSMFRSLTAFAKGFKTNTGSTTQDSNEREAFDTAVTLTRAEFDRIMELEKRFKDNGNETRQIPLQFKSTAVAIMDTNEYRAAKTLKEKIALMSEYRDLLALEERWMVEVANAAKIQSVSAIEGQVRAHMASAAREGVRAELRQNWSAIRPVGRYKTKDGWEYTKGVYLLNHQLVHLGKALKGELVIAYNQGATNQLRKGDLNARFYLNLPGGQYILVTFHASAPPPTANEIVGRLGAIDTVIATLAINPRVGFDQATNMPFLREDEEPDSQGRRYAKQMPGLREYVIHVNPVEDRHASEEPVGTLDLVEGAYLELTHMSDHPDNRGRLQFYTGELAKISRVYEAMARPEHAAELRLDEELTAIEAREQGTQPKGRGRLYPYWCTKCGTRVESLKSTASNANAAGTVCSGCFESSSKDKPLFTGVEPTAQYQAAEEPEEVMDETPLAPPPAAPSTNGHATNHVTRARKTPAAKAAADDQPKPPRTPRKPKANPKADGETEYQPTVAQV